MLIDTRNRRLIDTTTNLSSREYSATTGTASINPRNDVPPTPGQIFGLNASACFQMKKNSTWGGTPHQDHARISRLQQTSTPCPRSYQQVNNSIRAGDGAKSDTAIEESMGIISACRSAERRRPTTLRQLPAAERPHRTRQVLAAALEDFAHQLHGMRIFSKIDLVRAYHQISIAPEERTSKKRRSLRRSECRGLVED